MRTRKPVNPAPLSSATALGFLLKSHYLADEFPSVVTTTNFADYCVANHASLPSVDTLLKRTTLYGTFSMPRTASTRRVLALPHPTSQLALSRIIADHSAESGKTIDSSLITLYDTKPDAKKSLAFLGIDFNSRPGKEMTILSRHPVILKADIANFFHTIYTHSIPWGVLGKQHVKDIREGKDKKAKSDLEKHWASLLDVAIQRGNSRETFGIPVGPDTSRIVAELLLVGVHKSQPFAQMIDGHGAYRIVDDFFIGFEDETSARRCLDELRRALWEFNLHLSEDKTKIIHSTFIVDSGWKFELDNFQFSDKSDSEQRSGVERLLEIALGNCETTSSWLPIAFFCHRLLALKIFPNNLPFIRDCMLRIGRDFTTCLKLVAQFMIHYRADLRDNESRGVIEEWARHILSVHARRGHDYEVALILVICGILGFSPSQSFVAADKPIVSPIVLAVLGLLSADGLLAESWDDWSDSLPGSGTFSIGRYWLPYYEAVLRRWTKKTSITKGIREDPLFVQLLKAKVTFLDDADFLGKTKMPPRPRGIPSLRGTIARAPIRALRTRVTPSYE